MDIIVKVWQQIVIVNNMFEKIVDIFKQTLFELNNGYLIDSEKLSKMWDLLHALHFTSFESEDTKSVYKILDYYE